MNEAHQAIGVFDSGVGGLTVVRALSERLPCENIVYFGDTARVPYGTKSRGTIEQFSAQITQFLLEQNVKLLVIACNTIAAVAGAKVRALAGALPVLDVIGAGADAAVAATHSGHIGVMATVTTVNSNAYARAVAARKEGCRVVSQACPLLVPLIEEGWLDHPVTRLTLREYLPPLLAEGIDTLILGCTHYPLLLDKIRKFVPEGIKIVSQGEYVASSLKLYMERHPEMDARCTKGATCRYYTTESLDTFLPNASIFLNSAIDADSITL